MALTLADIITSAMDIAPQDPSGRLQYDWLYYRKAVNRHYRDILSKSRWSFLTKETVFSTTAKVSAGTIATVAGSATITGTGTGWTSSIAGMYLATSAYPILKISSVNTGAQTAVLEAPYPITSSGTYNIIQPYYGLAADFYTPLTFNIQWLLLGPYAHRSFDLIDAYRGTQTVPRAYSYAGVTQATSASATVQQIELWPVPDAAYICRYQYIQKTSDLTAGTDVPILPRSDVLVWGAIIDAWANYAAQMGQPNFADGAKPFAVMYQDAIESMIDRDIPLQNRPDVQQQNNLPFQISDDVLYKLGQPLPIG